VSRCSTPSATATTAGGARAARSAGRPYFADDAVVARRGELARFEPSYAARPTRYFCAACGTTLCWTSEVFMPGHTGVAGGCFTQAPMGEPTVTASDEKRCAWLGLPQTWFASP
jgi:hypothetical protein